LADSQKPDQYFKKAQYRRGMLQALGDKYYPHRTYGNIADARQNNQYGNYHIAPHFRSKITAETHRLYQFFINLLFCHLLFRTADYQYSKKGRKNPIGGEVDTCFTVFAGSFYLINAAKTSFRMKAESKLYFDNSPQPPVVSSQY